MNCRTCGSPLLVKATKPNASQLTKQYYYTHYYFCPNCQKMYLNDKFKVQNENFDLFTHSPRPHPNPLLQGEGIQGIVDVEIWTDGACSNNGKVNAKASWAFVSGDREEAGIVDGKQTNNRGEAQAIYHALTWAASKGYKQIKLHSDSQITLQGVIKHPERVKENRDIFQKIHDVVTKNHLQIEYVKVLGHSGDPNNERADKLAVKLTLQ